MDKDFFKSTNAFLSSNKYSKDTVLSVIIDENEKIFLQRKEAKLFTEKLIKLARNHKDKDIIYNQLFKYSLMIK